MEEQAATADIIFMEEMPTTELKKIRIIPLKLDERIVELVEKMETLIEKMNYGSIENTKKISNIILDLSTILERVQKTSANKEIFDRINDIYYKLDSTQLDDEKIYEIGNRIEVIEGKIDNAINSLTEISSRALPDTGERSAAYLDEISNELASTLASQAGRLEGIEGQITQLASSTDDISNTLSGFSFEQLKDKLQMLSEIDRRSAYLSDIADELTATLAKESSRMDRLEKYIDQTSIESENLTETIEQVKNFVNKTKKRYSRVENDILSELKILKESTTAMIDRIIIDVLEDGDRRLSELITLTGLSAAMIEKRLKELAEVRVRLRGEGTDVFCSLIR
ncbi:MAG: hypothetical protein HZB67_00610 [Candidatus Aenigmarchaeota archaeon]|nr:hypothetical protein [Candidatus Aenigmarchaeota archaeon]